MDQPSSASSFASSLHEAQKILQNVLYGSTLILFIPCSKLSYKNHQYYWNTHLALAAAFMTKNLKIKDVTRWRTFSYLPVPFMSSSNQNICWWYALGYWHILTSGRLQLILKKFMDGHPCCQLRRRRATSTDIMTLILKDVAVGVTKDFNISTQWASTASYP